MDKEQIFALEGFIRAVVMDETSPDGDYGAVLWARYCLEKAFPLKENTDATSD